MSGDIVKSNGSRAKRLTPKQQAFVNEYIACRFNGTKACESLGYKNNSARTTAARMLANINIRAAIDAYMRDHVGVNRHRVLLEIAKYGLNEVETPYVSTKNKCIDHLARITGLDQQQQHQQPTNQVPLVQLLVENPENIEITSVVGLPPHSTRPDVEPSG